MAQSQLYNRETNNNIRYTDSTAKAGIDSLYNLIQKGQDFSALAVMYSQDPGSYKLGGELKASTMGEYVKEYRDVVLGLSPDGFSKPFKTDFGYHIVQLVSKKDGLYLTRHILLRVD